MSEYSCFPRRDQAAGREKLSQSPSPRARDQYFRPVSQRTVATVALGLSTPLESILAAAQTFAAAVKPTCRRYLVASRCFRIAASSSLTAREIDISPGSHIAGTLS